MVAEPDIAEETSFSLTALGVRVAEPEREVVFGVLPLESRVAEADIDTAPVETTLPPADTVAEALIEMLATCDSDTADIGLVLIGV